MTGATLVDEDANSMLDCNFDCDVAPDVDNITDAVATDAFVLCNWRENEVLSKREHVDVVLAVDLAKTVNTSGLWCH